MGTRSRLPVVAVTAFALVATGLSGPAPAAGRPSLAEQCWAAVAAPAAAAGHPVDTTTGSCYMVIETESAAVSGVRWPGVRMFPPLNVPLPVDLAVDGRAGCVTGPDRPVVATATPVLTAAFAGVPVTQPLFEYAELGDPFPTMTGSESAVLDFEPGDLAPGASYRWRVRGADGNTTSPGWSDWCEFTVNAAAVDYRGVHPADLEALAELRIRPDRRYAVALTAVQRGMITEVLDGPDSGAVEDAVTVVSEDGSVEDGGVLEVEEPESEDVLASRALAADVRAQSGDVTLTGAQWAAVVNDVAGWASILHEVALETEPEPEFRSEAPAYWKLVDAVSAGLGGPARPGLGYDR
jgi:hypothetical protein